jgi:hypothetical protein
MDLKNTKIRKKRIELNYNFCVAKILVLVFGGRSEVVFGSFYVPIFI